MAMDQTPQGQGRRHFHRGRRGPDRRPPDRRGQQASEPSGRDQVDIEQLMRDIRGRIAQRHGVELTGQQIQDLAAHRLEGILDIRTVKPELLAELRSAAGRTMDVPQVGPVEPPPAFDDSSLYGGAGVLGTLRRILNPLLRLLFDPDRLVQALKAQADLNATLVARDAARAQQQAEWNGLHFEILQRLVTETSRISLEMQSLSLRIESLSAKVDFNERRVRTIEGAAYQSRPAPPRPDVTAAGNVSAAADTGGPPPGQEGPVGDASRRRRRRRRGRRAGGGAEPVPGGMPQSGSGAPVFEDDGGEDVSVESGPEPVTATPGDPLPAATEARSDEIPRSGEDAMLPRDEPFPGTTQTVDPTDPTPTDR